MMRGMLAPDVDAPKGSSRDQNMIEEGSQPVRILVVDDDPAMQHMVVDYFEQHNMSAVSASGREAMASAFALDEPSLVILDLRLGQEDGLDLLREMRSRSDVPVIITTGHRRDEIDRVVGLELGADDYVTKPFNMRELLARVRAVLRRRESGRVTPERAPERGRFRFGGWRLDQDRRSLTDPSGSPVSLTKGEYALLIAFLDAPQRPLSREYLLQATRVHEDIFDRSIDVQVLRLRRKLETDSSMPRFIRTERGVGYVFAVPVEKLQSALKQSSLGSREQIPHRALGRFPSPRT
jgi:two-component system, OmpR family, response regulator